MQQLMGAMLTIVAFLGTVASCFIALKQFVLTTIIIANPDMIIKIKIDLNARRENVVSSEYIVEDNNKKSVCGYMFHKETWSVVYVNDGEKRSGGRRRDEGSGGHAVTFYGKESYIASYLERIKSKNVHNDNTTVYRTSQVMQYSRWGSNLKNIVSVDFMTHDQSMIVDYVRSIHKRSSMLGYFYTGVFIYGDPGTGKSQTKHILASHLDVNAYIYDVCSSKAENTVTEEFDGVYEAVQGLTGGRGVLIVCIDEVDCIIKGFNNVDDAASQQQQMFGNGKVFKDKREFLGFLDYLKGHNNIILLFTSNEPLSYFDGDNACYIRDGRIDLKAEFRHIDKTEIKRCIRHLSHRINHAIAEDTVDKYVEANDKLTIAQLETMFKNGTGLFSQQQSRDTSIKPRPKNASDTCYVELITV